MTRFPGVIAVRHVRPSIGARMGVYPRSVRTDSGVALASVPADTAWLTLAWFERAAARIDWYSVSLMALDFLSSSARARSALALVNSASARSLSAFALACAA